MQANPSSSIPIVVVTPIVIAIVVVAMMPAAPPIFVGVTVMAVARVVLAIVIRSLVSRTNVNAEAFIRFRLGGYRSNQPDCCQSQKKDSFHINCSMVRREWDPSSCSSHVRIRLLPDAFRKMDRLRNCAIDLAELVVRFTRRRDMAKSLGRGNQGWRRSCGGRGFVQGRSSFLTRTARNFSQISASTRAR